MHRSILMPHRSSICKAGHPRCLLRRQARMHPRSVVPHDRREAELLDAPAEESRPSCGSASPGGADQLGNGHENARAAKPTAADRSAVGVPLQPAHAASSRVVTRSWAWMHTPTSRTAGRRVSCVLLCSPKLDNDTPPPHRSAASRPTPLGCTTATATWPSGAETGWFPMRDKRLPGMGFERPSRKTQQTLRVTRGGDFAERALLSRCASRNAHPPLMQTARTGISPFVSFSRW